MISANEKSEIERIIEQAEGGHRGEIVPMIVKSSDSYPAAHFRLALLFSFFSSMALYHFPYPIDDPIWYLWVQVPACILGYLLAYRPGFKRFFSTKAEMKEEVHQRALEAFVKTGVTQTKDRTGLLIFISMLEHRVELIADSGIHSKVDKDLWRQIVTGLSVHIKKGQLVAGLTSAINECGRVLNEHFPVESEQALLEEKNELANKLIVEGDSESEKSELPAVEDKTTPATSEKD
jgi:putative membrane protein